MIYNLAQVSLSEHEKDILNKGLKFCPTPPKSNPIVQQEAIEIFHRKLLLQAYHNKDGSNSTPKNTHLDATQAFIQQNKAPSVWVPQRNDCHPLIYDFAQTLNEELKRITHKGRRNRQNLNTQQQKALKKPHHIRVS